MTLAHRIGEDRAEQCHSAPGNATATAHPQAPPPSPGGCLGGGSPPPSTEAAAALEFAREGDVLVVAPLNRLARSMRQLLTIVDVLTTRGIGLRSLHANFDTTSATGRLILHIFAALGQFRWSFCMRASDPLWRPAAPVAVSVAIHRR